MSREARQGLLSRVANALLALESLSDAATAKLDPNKVHGGDQTGVSTLRDKSAYEYHATELAGWCERAEARAEKERRRVAGPMTKLEEDFWFRQHEGRDYRSVAEREGMDAIEVWRKRERMGLNPKDGRPIEQAA